MGNEGEEEKMMLDKIKHSFGIQHRSRLKL